MQQELAKEMTAITADLTQAREHIVSQEFMLAEKNLGFANKDKELASWTTEATQIQREIEWEHEERGKAQAEATETVKMRVEV